ncbi:hypothetical protein SAMN05421823_104459 [Catalinimonas alkaloidigena]|uniref:Uncharacterized protein n=2 Tax=Catalinimonas alkaloidigena TaxID=1075417 RepID=A0A1G9HKC1_9BACT|nr:hypothetical protein SAMN05421823_104459 [Catalinimonas alkaloidigena]
MLGVAWTLSAGSLSVCAQAPAVDLFPLASVRLLDGPFRQAEQVDLDYILTLEPDRLLAPYLREAGLTPKADTYGNWEGSGLDGHIGGHYLTALAQMAADGHQEARDRLNYMIGELKRCQDANGNGYIGGTPGGKAMWQEVAQGHIDAGSFSLNGKWVPWYNLHKLYAGLRDAYLIAGNEEAKAMLIRLTDWSLNLVAGLSDAQVQDMLRSEHGGMNEVFADVAALTGDEKYLALARRFSHRVVLEPLLAHKDQLTGMHANTQIPKVIGFKRIAEVGGDTSWADAAAFFWETVVDHRTVTIGGNSVREHFHPADDFTPMITDREGPESCNTYNMLRLSKMLYQTSRSLSYLDYYERALYNHILSTQHPTRGGFVYFTPMRPQHYRVYSQPAEGMWCCVGSGLENHGKYGELIYAHTDQDLFVNLFIPSELTWAEKGVTLTQQTNFPDEETTRLTIQPKKATRFTLRLRYPAWVAKGAMQVNVNGKAVPVVAAPDTYVAVDRKWKKGDVVEVTLPMENHVEQLPDGSDYFAVLHGPIVLAAKTSTQELDGLQADDSRMGHIAAGPLYPMEEAPMLVSADAQFVDKIRPVPGKPLTFTAPDLIYPQRFANLELIPFFRLHDARYMLYWQHTTPEGLKAIQARLKREEEARLALEAITIDQVAPGEQQPESDHFFKGERTESGIYRNRHWRHAKGWFSYALKDKQQEAAALRVTYSGQDRDRQFDILVNETRVATVALDGSQGDTFFTVDYPLPPELIQAASDKTLVVKFAAHPGSMAGGIYHVRLLRAH